MGLAARLGSGGVFFPSQQPQGWKPRKFAHVSFPRWHLGQGEIMVLGQDARSGLGRVWVRISALLWIGTVAGVQYTETWSELGLGGQGSGP